MQCKVIPRDRSLTTTLYEIVLKFVYVNMHCICTFTHCTYFQNKLLLYCLRDQSFLTNYRQTISFGDLMSFDRTKVNLDDQHCFTHYLQLNNVSARKAVI